MPQKITVDFFRVRIDNGARFEDLLSHISQLTARQRNLRLSAGDVLRLHSLHIGHQLREGEMNRIRLRNLPARANLEGDLSAIDLGDEEGLAEQAAFIYRPNNQVLALQRNRHSLTPNNFAYYVAEKGGHDAPIFFEPVLQENALARLAGFREIRRFDVRFARVNNAAAFANRGASTRKMIDLLEYFSAPTADITLSMGHQRGTLPVERIKTAARALFGGGQHRGPGDVKRIEITGTDQEGERDVLDLVQFRMVETVDVQGEGNRLPYGARREALVRAFESRRAEVARMFTDDAD